MERELESYVYRKLADRYILRSGLGKVTGMIEWNKQSLKDLVQKMKLRRAPGQEKAPIHLNLYCGNRHSHPFLTQVMMCSTNRWQTLGYDETDRVSLVRYLGNLGCRTEGALSWAAILREPLTMELAKTLVDIGASDEGALAHAACCQHLTLELAQLLIDVRASSKNTPVPVVCRQSLPLTVGVSKLLVDAEDYDKSALAVAAYHQQPLSFEPAKILMSAGCNPAAQDKNGWDALVCLAGGGHPADPQVTDLFLSAGCRTDLDGCTGVFDRHRLRFDRILKEHAEWKTQRNRLLAEHSPTDAFYSPDWDR